MAEVEITNCRVSVQCVNQVTTALEVDPTMRNIQNSESPAALHERCQISAHCMSHGTPSNIEQFKCL